MAIQNRCGYARLAKWCNYLFRSPAIVGSAGDHNASCNRMSHLPGLVVGAVRSVDPAVEGCPLGHGGLGDPGGWHAGSGRLSHTGLAFVGHSPVLSPVVVRGESGRRAGFPSCPASCPPSSLGNQPYTGHQERHQRRPAERRADDGAGQARPGVLVALLAGDPSARQPRSTHHAPARTHSGS